MKHLKIKIFFILLLAFQLNCEGQQLENKNKISLDGTWEIIFDENNKGVQEKWYLIENFGKQTKKKNYGT